MIEDEIQWAGLAAVLRSDLMTSGARTVAETKEAPPRSAASLQAISRRTSSSSPSRGIRAG